MAAQSLFNVLLVPHLGLNNMHLVIYIFLILAYIFIPAPPHVQKDFQEQQVEKGETLKLKIPFSGTGPFSFKLKKDNREVPDSNQRVKVIPFDDYVILQIKGISIKSLYFKHI